MIQDGEYYIDVEQQYINRSPSAVLNQNDPDVPDSEAKEEDVKGHDHEMKDQICPKEGQIIYRSL